MPGSPWVLTAASIAVNYVIKSHQAVLQPRGWLYIAKEEKKVVCQSCTNLIQSAAQLQLTAFILFLPY